MDALGRLRVGGEAEEVGMVASEGGVGLKEATGKTSRGWAEDWTGDDST